MQLWFTCKENELNGPYSDKEIHKLISEGDLGANDWLRRAEEAKWSIVAKHQDFQNLQKQKMQSPSEIAEKWVLLKQIDGDYKQSGPYSQIEVLALIYSGDFTYNDFAWQQGFKEWVRIGSIDSFIPKKETKSEQQTNNKQQEEKPEQMDLFANIEWQAKDHPDFYKDQELPVETTEAKENAERHAVKGEATRKSGIPDYYRIQPSKKRRWWFLSFFNVYLIKPQVQNRSSAERAK